MLFLPRNLRDDAEYRKQWIDNNLTYLDTKLLEKYLDEDKDYMKFTWPEYHIKHACRLGVCPRSPPLRGRQVPPVDGDSRDA
eukprot:scaffold24196_cov120-Isochrysis_galbana.AAC.6